MMPDMCHTVHVMFYSAECNTRLIGFINPLSISPKMKEYCFKVVQGGITLSFILANSHDVPLISHSECPRCKSAPVPSQRIRWSDLPLTLIFPKATLSVCVCVCLLIRLCVQKDMGSQWLRGAYLKTAYIISHKV